MNAIVLMAIGGKYGRHLDAVRASFLEYSSLCAAELVVCDAAPDPSFKRNLLCQKMLLPHLYKQYEWIAFFDLDVLISRLSPSIFDFADDGKAFAAVVDQRGSFPFANVVNEYWKQPRILAETHESYFSERGFPDHPFPKASINGGVWLCRPSAISDMFKDFYFSDFPPIIHEEAMMAYVAQRANLFFELDSRFNAQLIYELYASLDEPALKEAKSRSFQRFKRYCDKNFPQPKMYSQAYRALVDKALERCYCLHFSAGFPYINIGSRLALASGSEAASPTEPTPTLFFKAIRNLSSPLDSLSGWWKKL